MNNDEINERMEILNELNTELDEYDALLHKLFSNKETSYSEIMQNISPDERIDLNWNLSFSSYTLYYSKFIINRLFKVT